MTLKADMAELVGVLLAEETHHGREQAELDVRELVHLAKAIQRRAEIACNEPLSDRQAALAERNDARAYHRAQQIADRYGAKVLEQTDVRGFAIKLLLKSGRYNSWGGAECGWGVPTV